MTKSWWVDTGYACGLVETEGNTIVDTAPIWRKWIGSYWGSFVAYHLAKYELLDRRTK